MGCLNLGAEGTTFCDTLYSNAFLPHLPCRPSGTAGGER